MTRKTFYDVLQVSRNADPETITAAYRSLVQRHHPDKNQNDPNAEGRLKDINCAYEVLSDAVKRAAYDAALAEDDTAQTQHPKDESSLPGNDANLAGSSAAYRAGRFFGTIRRRRSPAARFDRSPSPTIKRNYLALVLDLLPAGAAGQFFSKWATSSDFHGSPAASALVVGGAYIFGAAVGYVVCNYLRTQLTKTAPHRGVAIFESLFLSLGLSIVIFTAAGALSRSAHDSDAASAVPVQGASHGNAESFDSRNWSGTPSDRFGSVGAIEARARRYSALNSQRAWSAVIAGQAFYMSGGNKANEALYWAIGDVLHGLKNNKGICRHGTVEIVVDAASASPDFPVGTRLFMDECDR